MSEDVADPGPHTTAFLALLTAEDVVVGDATFPTVKFGWQGTPGRSTFIPHAIVHPMPYAIDGSLGCPDSDSDFSWQVTCVGSTRLECDAVLHATNVAVIGSSLTVAGRSVARIRCVEGGASRRDDSANPVLFIATPRFAAWST